MSTYKVLELVLVVLEDSGGVSVAVVSSPFSRSYVALGSPAS